MDFSLTEDQQALAELSRTILSPRSPFADDASYPPDGWFDEDAWKELAQSNLLGIPLAEDVGGLGMGQQDLALLLEEAGRAVTCLPLVPAIAGAALTIDDLGTDEQRQALLPGLIDGSHVLTVALAEPAEVDPLHIHTDAVPTDGGFVLNGAKSLVSSADRALRILVPARLPDGRIVLALVDPSQDGVTLAPQTTPTGEPQFLVTLTDVTVPSDEILGDADNGLDGLRATVQRVSLGLAAVQLGVAEHELRVAADYTSQREQFGRPIATFQAIACRLGDSLIDTRAMRATLQSALWLLDNGKDATREVTIAKLWAAEGGERVATQAVYLHGGMGVDTDYPLHRYFLASKMLELQLGSATWQVTQLGRHLATTGASS